MIFRRMLKIFATVALCVAVAGCGGGGSSYNSGTFGTLSLELTPANINPVNISAKATVSPNIVGSEVQFTARQYGNDGTGIVTNILTPPATTPKTDSSGTAHAEFIATPRTYATTVEVIASCNGLWSSKTVSIAAAP